MIPTIDSKPPGKKLIKRMPAKTKAFLLTPAGLVLFSYGLTILTEAGFQRRSGADMQIWLLLGAYSLGLINVGLICLGFAVRFYILSDVRRETRRSIRQLEQKISNKSKQHPRKSKPVRKTKSPTKSN
ncbi:hypothetical protein [Dyadobacter tibetensis]|uniref:hypothetical protein n=1 Tax=Dyadobacter tibetensis TaxID=1211851 RepID=UPI00046FA92E|nr:hypothetical protein [Dyadobacter tibetensis]